MSRRSSPCCSPETPPRTADFCACRVADYAIPETWSIGIEPLPRTATGKVIKRELRRAAMAAAVNE